MPDLCRRGCGREVANGNGTCGLLDCWGAAQDAKAPFPPVTFPLSTVTRELPPTLPPQDHTTAYVAELERELVEARQAAAVLAHAWDHDSAPPKWTLVYGRRWDAYGKERK